MNIHPIDNWLVIKPRPIKTVYGKLALPEGTDNPILPVLGDVIAAGPGRRNEAGDVLKMRVVKGDVVLLNGLTARPLTLGLDNHVIMLREHEVAATVTVDAPAPTLHLINKES